MRYPFYTELNDLIEQKLVSKRPHPSLPLFIYNYTAASIKVPRLEWSTAMRDARGLILDDGGHIVGRPFKKFWNYEQVLDQIPTGMDYTVWDKLDGSLGVFCEYDGRLVVGIRGSFESDQAKWAYDQAKVWQMFPDPDLTYLFEIIYPENRIVVDYKGESKMYLLAVLDKFGKDRDDVFEDYTGNFAKVQRHTGPSIAALKALNIDNREGFVIRWDNGFRAKIKFAEYERLHRLITECSTRSIWEMLRTGQSTAELLDRVPEDFRGWATNVITSLSRAYTEMFNEITELYARRPTYFSEHRHICRKEFAEWAKHYKYNGMLFSLYDGKSINQAIWDAIEPKWERPFRHIDE